MDTNKLDSLRSRAREIRTEQDQGENTAERVGSLFYDMLDYDNEQSNAVTSLEGRVKTLEQSQSGGGSGNEKGSQKTYFLNTPQNTVPEKPLTGDYQLNNTFVHNGDTWKNINENPAREEDTWAIWVWFVSNTPTYIDGPVKLRDSLSGLSNGEDGQETEWIYKKSSVKWDDTTINNYARELANCTSDKDARYSLPDQYPDDWLDNPQGIDSDNKYEYVSFRKSSTDPETGQRVWGKTGFSTPVLWSNWGEKGMDGDGVEYIFYADGTGTTPPAGNEWPPQWDEMYPDKFQDPEFIPENSAWKDEPIDLAASGYGQGTIEWVSIRKKQEGIWQPYSDPAVWSRLAKDGIVDGYTVDLTNENMPVGTDDAGDIPQFPGYENTTTIQVYYNGVPQIYQEGEGIPDLGYFKYSIGTITRSDGGDVSTITAKKEGAVIKVEIKGISGFSNVNARVPITVTLPNKATRQVVLTLFGVAVGAAGTVLDLYLSTSIIHTNFAKTNWNPGEVQVGIKIGSGDDTKILYSVAGGGEGTAEGAGFVFDYYFDNGAVQPSEGNIQIPEANHSTLTVRMFKGNRVSSYMIDSETLHFVSDGKDGDNGRGVASITHYNRAVEDMIAPQFNPEDVGTKWFDDSQLDQCGWSETKRFLYCVDITHYTIGTDTQSTVYLKSVWGNKGDTSSSDGYSLIINPHTVFFDEEVDSENPTPGPDGSLIYKAKTINTNGKTISLQIVKDDDQSRRPKLQHDGLTSRLCDVTVEGYDQATLQVKINSIKNDSDTEGTIELWVTDEGLHYFKAIIPVYINRLGSRVQTIIGDTETTIMSKIKYGQEQEDHEPSTVNTFQSLGTYVRSSEKNVSTLQNTTNKIQTDVSYIQQTADAISLGVQNGWYNYISNPEAINATVTGEVVSATIVSDPIFGDVRQIRNDIARDWQLRHSLSAGYRDLTSQYVTWFCIVKNVNTGGTQRLLQFGSGFESVNSGNQHAAIIMTAANGNITVAPGLVNPTSQTTHEQIFYYDMSTLKYGKSTLDGGWAMCWVSIKLGETPVQVENRSIIPGDNGEENNILGFNNMKGTWQIYYAGIVKGRGCPSIEMIKQGAGIKNAGIDITQGTIDLKADKTTFSYYDNSTDTWKSDKVWIDHAKGTLHAVDGSFSGYLNSAYGGFIGMYSANGRVALFGEKESNDYAGLHIGKKPLSVDVDDYTRLVQHFEQDVVYAGANVESSSPFKASGIVVVGNYDESTGTRKDAIIIKGSDGLISTTGELESEQGYIGLYRNGTGLYNTAASLPRNVITGNPATLPSGPIKGMFVFCIKAATIYGNGKNIYDVSGENKGTTWTTGSAKPRIFVYSDEDQVGWHEFYCGT